VESLGMRGLQFHENMIENQLRKHGLKLGDIRYILHTHLHIDHAGKDDLFPMNTTVVVNRKELEYSVSGLMHPQYPAPDIKHLVDRLHTRHALRLLDLEVTGELEIMPGVRVEAAGAHTEGSMNVHVDTAEGLATICGDVIYDFQNQIIDPWISKLLNRSRFLLPVHDKPAMIEAGQVVGRLQEQVPGPIVQSLPRRNWFPA
jgi:glyoxylase-like metal-dependent hydrolase (beta-lactamase superfamily II)